MMDPGIRKSAIIVASLDRDIADVLLHQMSPENTQEIRQAIFELGSIDPEEERQTINEFLSSKTTLPDGRRVRFKLEHSGGSISKNKECSRFGFLHEAEDVKLAAVLASERPQMIALVLSHLFSEHAGRVLINLRPEIQVEVLRRLVDLEEADQDTLRDVEESLRRRLSSRLNLQRRRVAGVSAVTGILDSLAQAGTQIIDNLAAHDAHLAGKIRPVQFDFRELPLLDDGALLAIFEEIELEVITLALIGETEDFCDRMLSKMSHVRAEAVRYKLKHIVPTKLGDVEEAQQQIVAMVKRWVMSRRINLPRVAAG